ncbi:vesicle transport protein USE1-like [Ruditapes philippinarum]|uniref:vesicle transport protein USE1-like n=1 Tax=Ruditapes philippinarum TaxID=129788 RepID=UPI00295AB810|nr:vesicle transport protein USE1-like [Ruditapes philippinarum]
MSTKLEINFNRLLKRCESIANDRETWNWRLDKYVEALQEQLGDLKRSTSKPSQEIILEYTRRVDFLKGLLEAEHKQTTSEKALATEILAPVNLTQKTTGVAPKEVHLHAKSRLQKDLRSELLGEDSSGSHLDPTSNGVRQRRTQEDGDIDAVLKQQRKVQERLAEELLSHTLNLKDFAVASSSIVKKDIEKIGDTNKLADKNYSNLQRESQRLEAKTKSCSWWIWIMLVLVTLTFLWMVVLMRLFPKS